MLSGSRNHELFKQDNKVQSNISTLFQSHWHCQTWLFTSVLEVDNDGNLTIYKTGSWRNQLKRERIGKRQKDYIYNDI
jgi:hypothetical protein